MRGSNFRYVDEWKVLTGSAWNKWQIAALEACAAGATFHGDQLTEKRFKTMVSQKQQVAVSLSRESGHRR
ncbi:MAG: hypothetical protein AAGG47_08655 [Pseudomonadota bacterium]